MEIHHFLLLRRPEKLKQQNIHTFFRFFFNHSFFLPIQRNDNQTTNTMQNRNQLQVIEKEQSVGDIESA